MAIAHIIFGDALDLSKGGGGVPALYDNAAMVSETITSFATHAETGIVAPKLGNNPVCVVATDTNLYMSIGASPNATADTTSRHFIPAGAIWGVICAPGDKASVVAA